MMDHLFQIRDKKNKAIEISETLLLASQFDNISTLQRRFVKEVLCEFIAATSRAL